MSATMAQPTALQRTDLTELISEEEWGADRAAIHALRERDIAFALGGGLAFSAYSGRPRNTKDFDLFIPASLHEAAFQSVTAAGFADYYAVKPYDRSWIHRACRRGVIVDLIWTMPNHRMNVKDHWLRRGPDVYVHGEMLRLLAPEELLWVKLYVLQHDRSDWPDLLSILYSAGKSIDWERMLGHLGEDAPLLGGLLSVFRWLCPNEARSLPEWLWPRAGLVPPNGGRLRVSDGERAHLLDTRDWFGPSPDTAHR